jgi:hypothetical protein
MSRQFSPRCWNYLPHRALLPIRSWRGPRSFLGLDEGAVGDQAVTPAHTDRHGCVEICQMMPQGTDSLAVGLGCPVLEIVATAHQHGYTSSGGFLPTLLYTASREQSVEIGVKNGVAGARRARR